MTSSSGGFEAAEDFSDVDDEETGTPGPTPAAEPSWRQAQAAAEVRGVLEQLHRYEDVLRQAHPMVRGDRLERGARNQEQIMAVEPGDRFTAVAAALDQAYGPQAGAGNLTHGGFRSPATSATMLHTLGFSDEQILAVMEPRIGQDGWMDSADLAAAVADLVDAPGSDLAYQQTQDAVAYRASTEGLATTETAKPSPVLDEVEEVPVPATETGPAAGVEGAGFRDPVTGPVLGYDEAVDQRRAKSLLSADTTHLDWPDLDSAAGQAVVVAALSAQAGADADQDTDVSGTGSRAGVDIDEDDLGDDADEDIDCDEFD